MIWEGFADFRGNLLVFGDLEAEKSPVVAIFGGCAAWALLRVTCVFVGS